jgi:hypothetical protein
LNRLRHIRRPSSQPDGPWSLIRCDCGWEGRTVGTGRTGPEIDASLEQVFRAHLPEAEARTYLLVDSRSPPDNASLEDLLAECGTVEEARAAFAAQPQIVGTFVMPIGEPVVLLRERIDDDVHFGTYCAADDPAEAELPVGEVRTPDGKVFRLDQ